MASSQTWRTRVTMHEGERRPAQPSTSGPRSRAHFQAPSPTVEPVGPTAYQRESMAARDSQLVADSGRRTAYASGRRQASESVTPSLNSGQSDGGHSSYPKEIAGSTTSIGTPAPTRLPDAVSGCPPVPTCQCSIGQCIGQVLKEWGYQWRNGHSTLHTQHPYAA